MPDPNQDQTIPAPPPGFVPRNAAQPAQSSSIPPPPPGFVPRNAAPQPESAPTDDSYYTTKLVNGLPTRVKVQPTHQSWFGSYAEQQQSRDAADQVPIAKPMVGAAKGMANTAVDVANRTAGALNLLGGHVEPVGHVEANDPHGVGEWLGYGGEQTLEFLMGEEALKGISTAMKLKNLAGISQFLEKYPRLGRILGDAVRQGAVGAGQSLLHTGSAGEALESGLVTGAMSGGLGLVGRAGEMTAGGASGQMLGSLDLSEAEGVQKGAASELKDVLNDIEQRMHVRYDSGMEAVSREAQGIPINMPGSALQAKARELMASGNVPTEIQDALKGIVPDKARVQPILKELSGSNATYSWDQVEAIRQDLGKSIRDLPFDSPIKRDLIDLRSSIDESMQDAAFRAGKGDVYKDIRVLRNNYALTSKRLAEKAIVELRGEPDSIAKVLLNRSNTISRLDNLRNLIGPSNMNAVEGKLWQNILEQSAGKNGELDIGKLKRLFDRMGSDVQEAIWGDDLPDVKYSVDALDKARKVSKVAGTVIGSGLGLAAGYGLKYIVSDI